MLKPHFKNPIKKKHVFIVGATVLLTVFSVFGVDQFFDHYDMRFRSPVVLQAPILLEKRVEDLVSPIIEQVQAEMIEVTPAATLTVTPTLFVEQWTPKANTTITDTYIAQAKNKWILWTVYAKESSRGVNDGCRAKGMYNGFGFGQSDEKMANGTGACYNTFPEVVSEVDKWFTKQLQTKSLPEAICYYNEGSPKGVLLQDCEYYQDILENY